jgi:hypothetical protein
VFGIYLLLFYVECHYTKCHYAECHYAECHYAECHYGDRHGSINIGPYFLIDIYRNRKYLLFVNLSINLNKNISRKRKTLCFIFRNAKQFYKTFFGRISCFILTCSCVKYKSVNKTLNSGTQHNNITSNIKLGWKHLQVSNT